MIQEDPALPLPVPLRYVSALNRVEDELGWMLQVGIDQGLQQLL
jgi:hypothetical protein